MEPLIIVYGEGTSKRKIRQLADWPAHGFKLIAEIKGRDDAISLIISQSPSLVIIDATLPISELRDIMEITRARGFDGHFFLVSSKSDFKAAYTGLKYGVDRYILLPADPAEFAHELKGLRERISEKTKSLEILEFYRSNAMTETLRNLVLSGKAPEKMALRTFGLEADSYQVAIFEPLASPDISSCTSFSQLVKSSGFERLQCSSFNHNGTEIILIKGTFSIGILREMISMYAHQAHENTGFFLSLGRSVSSLSSINISYSQAKYASDRKFLVPNKGNILTYDASVEARQRDLSIAEAEHFIKQILDCLQTFKRHNVKNVISNLSEYMISTQASSTEAKVFLTDMFLQIKESMKHIYSTANITLLSNSEIITFINRKSFISEVLAFFSDQFEFIMSNIGGTSRDSVLDDIFYYIDHNFSESIKLESLAPLFGYNSAYLGKIFKKAAGMSFNSYVDKLRIEHSITLLRNSEMKVYEIARQIGYKSVDYYHKKFRAITGESPAEYRKRFTSEDEQ